MWPLDSFHTFCHHSLPFTGHLTCSSLILQLLYVFTHVCVMSLDTQCVKCVLKSSDVLFHSSCHRCCVGGDDKHADMDIELLKSHLLSHFHLSYLSIDSFNGTTTLQSRMHDINQTYRISADTFSRRKSKITLMLNWYLVFSDFLFSSCFCAFQNAPCRVPSLYLTFCFSLTRFSFYIKAWSCCVTMCVLLCSFNNEYCFQVENKLRDTGTVGQLQLI